MFRHPTGPGILLLALQVILCLKFPAYRVVIYSYLFFFIVGSGLSFRSLDFFKNDLYSQVIYTPLKGFISTVIVGGFFIGLSIYIGYLASSLLLISISYGLYRVAKSNKFNYLSLQGVLLTYSRLIIIFSIIISPAILILISPVLNSHYLTSPFRVGPDVAYYAYIEQFFFTGGLWVDANKRAEDFIGLSAVEFNEYGESLLSWGIHVSFRWGLIAYTSLVTQISFAKHSYETIFLSMALPYIFQSGLVFLWLRNLKFINIYSALIGSLAFTFNPNLINLWYEGFYPNSIGLPIYTLLMMYLGFLIQGNSNNSKLSELFAYMSLFIAGVFCLPDAMFFIFIPFILFTFFVDAILNKRLLFNVFSLVLVGTTIALVLLPNNFIIRWAEYAWGQLTQAGGNGYMQPYWAWPHEILGYGNIYLETLKSPGILLERSLVNTIIGIISSIIVVLVLVLSPNIRILKNYSLHTSSIFLVIISVFLLSFFKSDNNYMYMKIYIFFSAIIFSFYWYKLACIVDKYFYEKKNIFLALFSLPIVISGVIYIAQYNVESTKITDHKINLYTDFEKIDFTGVLIYPFKVQSNLPQFAALSNSPWIVPYLWETLPWGAAMYKARFSNFKVYSLIEKDADKSPRAYNNIILENNKYILIDTKLKLSDAFMESEKLNLKVFDVDK